MLLILSDSTHTRMASDWERPSNRNLLGQRTVLFSIEGHTFCFKLSLRFEPVLDIVTLCPSSSKEQFVCSSRNVIFSSYTVSLRSYCRRVFCNNELDGFCFSLCL